MTLNQAPLRGEVSPLHIPPKEWEGMGSRVEKRVTAFYVGAPSYFANKKDRSSGLCSLE